MTALLGILKTLFEALPLISSLIRAFRKTPQEKVEKGIEEQRSDIDEFKRTGRPPKQ